MNNEPPPPFDAPSSREHGVSCRCEGTVLLDDGSVTVPVALAFRYAAGEPYSVRMVVDTGLTSPVEWVFARDLLSEGLRRPAGLGDVQTWPVPLQPQRLEAGEGAVHIRISSPEVSTVVSAPAATLQAFLGRTFEKVPAGSERHMLRIDESIACLITADRPEDGTA